MKRLLTLTIAALALAGCNSIAQYANTHHHGSSKNPYEGRIFYTKYLNPGASPLDARIQRDLDQLRANPDQATVHNDLGAALVEKGFPKDAETEFERAVNDDKNFYAAWYNLGLVRESRGDFTGARFAYGRTVHYKPGHALALFHLGLMSETSGHPGDAIDYYAKAFKYNRQLLDVHVNPLILDSKLVAQALIKAYPTEHAKESMRFQGTPAGYGEAAKKP